MKRLALALLLLSGAAYADDAPFDPVAHYQVTTSTSEASSTTMLSGTNALRVVCTAACWIATSVSSGATVATAPTYLPAGQVGWLRKNPATEVFVRVIGASGTLEITEANR